ncbi:hypothetical protein Hdeb2414_s0006g00208951 [Helianthus debilis subsp. tardiflorus]
MNLLNLLTTTIWPLYFLICHFLSFHFSLKLDNSLTNLSKSSDELPPSFTASIALFFISFAFNFSTLSPLIDSAIVRANRAESGTVFGPSQTRTATPCSSTNNLALTYWSASIGQASIITPAKTASKTEFHPQ